MTLLIPGTAIYSHVSFPSPPSPLRLPSRWPPPGPGGEHGARGSRGRPHAALLRVPIHGAAPAGEIRAGILWASKQGVWPQHGRPGCGFRRVQRWCAQEKPKYFFLFSRAVLRNAFMKNTMMFSYTDKHDTAMNACIYSRWKSESISAAIERWSNTFYIIRILTVICTYALCMLWLNVLKCIGFLHAFFLFVYVCGLSMLFLFYVAMCLDF